MGLVAAFLTCREEKEQAFPSLHLSVSGDPSLLPWLGLKEQAKRPWGFWFRLAHPLEIWAGCHPSFLLGGCLGFEGLWFSTEWSRNCRATGRPQLQYLERCDSLWFSGSCCEREAKGR